MPLLRCRILLSCNARPWTAVSGPVRDGSVEARDAEVNSAVERAIQCIWERYEESLTVTDLARSAILSKYHFCRTFTRVTGVSPGRFLAAVRIFQAKRLLLATAMNVTDISFAVGYSSLGSFTNHFTDSVGVPPGRFRRVALENGLEFPGIRSPRPAVRGNLTGALSLPDGHAVASVYVGAFSSAIVQGRPGSADILTVTARRRREDYSLELPPGDWFIHAVAVADTIDPEPWTRRVLLAGSAGLLRRAGGAGARADIRLRAMRPTDLPILLALPDLDRVLDEAVAGRQRTPAHALSRSGNLSKSRMAE